MSNKYTFIQNLLENEKFNLSQKERFLKLVSKELEKSSEVNNQILEEIKNNVQLKKNAEVSNLNLREIINEVASIKRNELHQRKINEKIEKNLSQLNNSSITNKSENKITNLEPNPKHVADFMTLFNQRKGLKYLTHDYDEDSEFNLDKFLISAHKVFVQETQKLNIPQSLWRIVQKFAFDSKQSAWTSISEDYQKDIPIKIGWATPGLRNWSKQNNLHPKRHEEFNRIINAFKRITRIERSNLDNLIDATLENVLGNEIENYKITKTALLKADFYSHVRFLKDAFKIIFEEIKKRSDFSDKREVTIKYERSISDEGYYLRKIVITHHNSFPNKELGLCLKEWQEKGNMGKIKEKLRGYCHWSVKTMIDGKPTKVNILKEKETPKYEIFNSEKTVAQDGFTHVLTFYYK